MNRVASVMGGENPDVRRSAVEAVTPFNRQRFIIAWNVVIVVVAQPDSKAFEVVLEHRVDHACDRIGAIDGRRAVAQHLDTFHAMDGDMRRVHGIDGHETAADLFSLVGRHVDEPAAVQQHQCIAGAEIAHIDGADVTTSRVDAACRVHFAEKVLAHLGYGGE